MKFKAVRLNSVTYPVEPIERQELEAAGASFECLEGTSPKEILAAASDCDALLVVASYLPAEVIDGLTRCRVISRLGAGVDRLDLEAARRRRIVVTNVPDFCENEQAEHAMALLLAAARRLPSMWAAMHSGQWNARHDPGVHRIAGRTLGLVGFGRSAQGLAARARAFDLKIIAYARPNPEREALARRLGVALVDLDTLLETSDFISLHLPLTSETRHLIDAKKLALLKPTATIVNTARGAIIDERALIDALRERRIAFAALDTFETLEVFKENGRVDHPLLALDNVLLTPHCAGSSVESTYESKRRGAENAALVLKGQRPTSIVVGDWL
jgi:D-3-phosphoglycerate dehydrogenase